MTSMLEFHSYTKQLIESQAAAIEDRLSVLGLSIDDIRYNGYKVANEFGGFDYYIFGKLIIRGKIEFDGNKIIAIVETP